MTTATQEQQHPQAKPLERARATVHQLLRRGMRIVAPQTEEERSAEEANRVKTMSRLNDDASAYFDWKELEEQAKREANNLRPGIQAVVERLGVVPDSAPKSRRAETVDFVCTVTTGTSMEIDDETVLALDLQMRTKAQQEIFDQLFIRRVEYSLAPTAHQLMQHGKLPRSIDALVRSHFSRAFSAKTTSPSLSVESKAAIEEKKRAAAEQAASKAAAKKAAKAGA